MRSGGPIHEAAQLIDNCAGGHAVGDPVEAEVAQAVVQVVTGEDVGYEVTAVGARVVCVVLVGAVAFALTLIADLIAVLQHQCDNVIQATHECGSISSTSRLFCHGSDGSPSGPGSHWLSSVWPSSSRFG